MAKEKASVEIEIIADKAQNTLGGLNDRLDRLKKKIVDEPIGTKKFEELQKAIQDTSSEIKVLEKNMEGLEPQQKAEAFLKMGEGIAGGFAVAQGAMAVMGTESENLQKVQARVQGAIAIAMGVRMMAEAKLQFALAKRLTLEKVAIAQTKIGAAVNKLAGKASMLYVAGLKAIGVAAKVSAGGMKILKLAIMSTGIGLLVVAIGTIAAYWDKIKGAMSGVSSEMQSQLTTATAAKDAAIETMEANEGSTNQMKLAGLSQKEIVQLRIKDVEAAIEAGKIEIMRQKAVNKSQYETAKRNQKILQGMLRFLMAPMDALVKLYNKVAAKIPLMKKMKLPSDWMAGKVFNADKIKKEGNDAIKQMEKNLNKLSEKSAGLQLELLEIEKAGNDARNAAANEQRKKEIQEQLDANQRELDAYNKYIEEKIKLEDEYTERQNSAIDQEKNVVIDKYFHLIEMAKKNGEDWSILQKAQEEELAEIQKKYDDERLEQVEEVNAMLRTKEEQEIFDAKKKFDEKIALAIELGMSTIELEKLKEEELKRIRKEYIDEELAADAEKLEAKKSMQFAMVDASREAVTSMGALFKEGSAASKAAALVDIAAGTATGFIKGLTIAQKSADATGPGAMLAFPIFYASQIAAVLGAVKKAKGILGAGGSETSPEVDNTSKPLPNTGAFTLGQAGGSTPEPVFKTYVVTDEMTDSQTQLEDIRRRSTI